MTSFANGPFVQAMASEGDTATLNLAAAPAPDPAPPQKKPRRTSSATNAASADQPLPTGAGAGAAAVAVGASGQGGKRAVVFEVDQHHHCTLCPAFSRLVASKAGGVLVNLDSHDDLGCPPTPNLTAAELQRLLSSGDAAALKAMDIGARSAHAPTLLSQTRVPDSYAFFRRCANRRHRSHFPLIYTCPLGLPFSAARVSPLAGTWIMPLVSSGAISTVIWVTAWAKIPKDSFDCFVVTEPEDGTIQVTGKGVPPLWRALWNAAYVEEPSCSADLGPVKVSSAEGTRIRMRFRDKLWYGGRVGPGNPLKGTRTLYFDDGDVRKGVVIETEVKRGALRAELPPAKNIGARIRLLALDGWWYGGRVISFDPMTQKHTIQFDDGDKLEYDLVEEMEEGNVRAESEADVVRTPLRVVVVDAKDAVRAINSERKRRRRARRSLRQVAVVVALHETGGRSRQR